MQARKVAIVSSLLAIVGGVLLTVIEPSASRVGALLITIGGVTWWVNIAIRTKQD
jgi:hypothetical protein